MQGPNAVLAIVTYPPGASNTQARIVIDGTRGAIFEYVNGGPVGALVSSWAAFAGTDPYGNPYPAGFNVGPNSQFVGNNFVINATGEFRWSGTPAPGNLIYSDVSVAGNDGHTNATLAGVTNYFNGSGFYVAINLFNGQLGFYSAVTEAGPWTLVSSLVYSFPTDTLTLDTPPAQKLQLGVNTSSVSLGTDSTNTEVVGLPVSQSTGGNLQVNNQNDTNIYELGKLTVHTAPNQLVNSTSPAAVSGAVVTVATAGQYHIRWVVIFNSAATAGAAVFSFGGTAVSGHTDGYNEWTPDGSGVTSSGFAVGTQFGNMQSPTLSSANFKLVVDEWVNFTTGGTMQLEAACTIATDTYTVKAAICELELVT